MAPAQSSHIKTLQCNSKPMAIVVVMSLLSVDLLWEGAEWDELARALLKVVDIKLFSAAVA